MIACDASTLILLAKAELLEPFLTTFPGPVLIPPTVERECTRKKTYDAQLIRQAIDDGRIVVQRPKQLRTVQRLAGDFGLGDGEAATVGLALDEAGTLVAIDDGVGIKACKLLRLGFTTAINILVWLYENGVLDQATAHRRLATLVQHGRYHHSMIADARARLERNR